MSCGTARRVPGEGGGHRASRGRRAGTAVRAGTRAAVHRALPAARGHPRGARVPGSPRLVAGGETLNCQRPGCTGTYAADGYCDECGHKAPAAATLTAGNGGAPMAAPAAAKPAAATMTATANATVGATAPSRPEATRAGLSGATGTGATGTGATGTGATVTGTGTSGRSRTGGRGRLGASLVAMPPVPLRDPASAVMADPKVPESQRFCSKCGEPVGRGRNGQPGRTEGFCPRDRTPYSFTPRLAPGDLVDDRYEILGALAHGGLGWIYLARLADVAVADRWVVLKGLINTGDRDAMDAAMAERRFLVEIDHR